eukprot:1162078-Pelagomonas_calceolata.AAC.4
MVGISSTTPHRNNKDAKCIFEACRQHVPGDIKQQEICLTTMIGAYVSAGNLACRVDPAHRISCVLGPE